MIKIENVQTWGWEPAIMGMRNPMNSWAKSDSYWSPEDQISSGQCVLDVGQDYFYIIGPNDCELMMNLRNAGTDHRKFMRMIVIYADITAPLYWWKEFDTYKVGTVANSCSTMHKLTEHEFTMNDFSFEDCEFILFPSYVLGLLNNRREEYLKTGDKKIWREMIQILPSSYNQKRTVMLNYEVLANIYNSRKNHKLQEWQDFCEMMLDELPFEELITGKEMNEGDV